MAFFNGSGGAGDATTDSTSQAIAAVEAAAQAAASASQASTSATDAASSATAAAASASNALSSSNTATARASASATSANAAALSATEATNQATLADASAVDAATSASSASGFSDLAEDWAIKTSGAVSGGEYSAKYHANAAASSASDASTSASNAATSESNAAASASTASTAATNAAASYDAFDDRYLGAKSSAPSVDNDGNSLITGALYWDTVSEVMQVWDGSAWVDISQGAGGSGTVTSVAMSVPTGLSVAGSPITSSGTLAVTYASGYAIPTTAKQTEWDTAYGWGNHASAGYLTSSAIGTTIQAYDADLTSWAAITPSSKQDTLVSGTNIKTVNSTSLLGSGNVSVGDVTGAASATDNAIARYDGTTGKLIQNSAVTIGDTGNTVISVTDNSNAALRITQLGTGNALLVEDSSNPDSTPFVINSEGTVVSGHTTTLGAGLAYNMQVAATGGTAGYALARYSANTGSPVVAFGKSRNTSVALGAVVASGDNLGILDFRGDDGAAWITGAQIAAQVDGTPGTNDMPGRLVFSTTADGASSPTERMRITNAGRVGIGTSSPTSGYLLDVAGGIKLGGAFDETVFAVSGTTPALSPANGTIQTWTLSGNSTPTAGTWNDGESLTLMINDGTAFTVTWTSVAVTWVGGTAPTLDTTRQNVIELWRVGGVIYGALVGAA